MFLVPSICRVVTTGSCNITIPCSTNVSSPRLLFRYGIRITPLFKITRTRFVHLYPGLYHIIRTVKVALNRQASTDAERRGTRRHKETQTSKMAWFAEHHSGRPLTQKQISTIAPSNHAHLEGNDLKDSKLNFKPPCQLLLLFEAASYHWHMQ